MTKVIERSRIDRTLAGLEVTIYRFDHCSVQILSSTRRNDNGNQNNSFARARYLFGYVLRFDGLSIKSISIIEASFQELDALLITKTPAVSRKISI